MAPGVAGRMGLGVVQGPRQGVHPGHHRGVDGPPAGAGQIGPAQGQGAVVVGDQVHPSGQDMAHARRAGTGRSDG